MYSEALVPQLIDQAENKKVANLLSVLGGVLLISLLAQVVFPLPWTPVPITGQTFAVAFVALLWGAKRATLIMSLYLGIGAMGAPVFAAGGSSLVLGPTLGYLVGMFMASFVVGTLADYGFTTSFSKSLIAAYMGSVLTFSCGVIGLTFFVPSEAILMAGVVPFLAGDFIKNVLAAYLSQKGSSYLAGK